MQWWVRFCAVVIFAATVAHAQVSDDFASMVRLLSSPNFKERTLATEALKARPEAEAHLRRAMLAADLETRRRLAAILEYYEAGPIREARNAIRSGRVDRTIEMLSRVPPKYDSEAWDVFRELCRQLVNVHEKKGGKKINLDWRRTFSEIPHFLNAKTVTEATKANSFFRHFIRCDEMDFDPKRCKSPKGIILAESPAILARRNVTTIASVFSPVIIAGGSITLTNGSNQTNTIILSGADIDLSDSAAFHCLIIARGNVFCKGGMLSNTRVICGKKLIYLHKRPPENSVISENDLNPLGFIRWSDVPPKISTPKGK